MLDISIHVHPSLMFVSMKGAYHLSGAMLRAPLWQPRLKRMELENTLAYYNTATITAVKCFIVQASGIYTIKLFMSVILGASG